MKINSDLLIDSKINGEIYANYFYSKNLARNQITTETTYGVTITVKSDGTMVLNGTATGTFVKTIAIVSLKAGKTYTISGVENASDDGVRLDVRYTAGGSLYGSWMLPNTPTYKISSDVDVYFSMRIASGATFNNLTVTPQLEIGDNATEFVPYRNFNNQIKVLPITEVVWTYSQTVKFYTLPYTSGTHVYVITGNLSYAKTALYSSLTLLVTQVDSSVSFKIISGSDTNSYSNVGAELYVKNNQANSPLRLFGNCIVLY